MNVRRKFSFNLIPSAAITKGIFRLRIASTSTARTFREEKKLQTPTTPFLPCFSHIVRFDGMKNCSIVKNGKNDFSAPALWIFRFSKKIFRTKILFNSKHTHIHTTIHKREDNLISFYCSSRSRRRKKNTKI
jgi:hypothetical protein